MTMSRLLIAPVLAASLGLGLLGPAPMAAAAVAAVAPAQSAVSTATPTTSVGVAQISRKAKAKARAKARARARAKARAARAAAAKAAAAKAAAAKAAAEKAAAAKAAAEKAAADAAALAAGSQGGTVRLADANLEFLASHASFAADLKQVLATSPDTVTLNEVGSRSNAQLTPAGYAMYRPTRDRLNGNAVLWRTDRWSLVEQGSVVIVDDGPVKYDRDRGATWVTLQGRQGQGRISVISTHHMQNPAKLGPDKPLRQQLYATGMARLKALVTELSAQGPVFMAGDFNSGFRENVAWSPRVVLGPIGVKAAMEKMGITPTHDGGGIIDYVFYQAARATVTSQSVTNLRSDHHLVRNDFSLVPVPASSGR